MSNYQQKEKLVLAGLLQHGKNVWPEINFVIKEKYFKYRQHKILFRVIKYFLENNNHPDYLLIIEKINDLNISFPDLDIAEYLELLNSLPITLEGTITATKWVVAAGCKREIYMACQKIEAFLQESEDDTDLSSIVGTCDKIYADTISLVEYGDKEPISLTKTLKEHIEHRGDDKEKPVFLVTPFPTFNKVYGGIRLKDSYCIAGRPGENKSTILQYLAFEMANRIPQNFYNGKPLKVLAIDTEMDEDEQRDRLGAAICGIDSFLIETGGWKKNQQLVKKVRTAIEKIDECNYDHIYTPRDKIEDLISIVRRWVYKNLELDEPGIIVFDYLKLAGDDLISNKGSERYVIGYKLDALKDEIKEKTNCAFLFGAQRNRYGADDDTSIAESDHIQKLATYVALLKKKSLDERNQWPIERFGSHSMITVKARKLASAHDYNEFVKVPWVDDQGRRSSVSMRNWINLDFDCFKMNEVGTGDDVVKYLESLQTVQKT